MQYCGRAGPVFIPTGLSRLTTWSGCDTLIIDRAQVRMYAYHDRRIADDDPSTYLGHSASAAVPASSRRPGQRRAAIFVLRGRSICGLPPNYSL
jgi:hypothetical protein